MVKEQEKPKMNTSVFEYFRKLTNKDERIRINGAAALIEYLEKTSEQKDVDYAIKRLVRGNGSSTSSSRIGFYTALTGALSTDIEHFPGISEILSLVKKEFKNKEDDKGKVDSMVGIALSCGAIIRSEKAFSNATSDEIAEITKDLAFCFTKPSVAPIGYNFLAELSMKTSSDVFKSSVWPNISKHLSVTKDQISIDSCYLLLLIEEHHPECIDSTFYKKNWQTKRILCEDNLETLAKLLWDVKKANQVNHPIYVYLVKRLIDTKLLKSFWTTHVDEILKSKVSKQAELITVNAAILILKNGEEKSKETLKVLTPNFLNLLLGHGTKIEKDEDIQEMYKELYELLDQRLQSLKKDETKLQAIKSFPQLSIEKNSIKKFVTNLINSLQGDKLKEAVDYVKSVITSDVEEKERQYTATVFHKIITTNKVLASDNDWRADQLIFLANLSFMKSADGVEITGSADSNAGNLKNIFYHCLEYKFANLSDEKNILLKVVKHIDGYISRKNHGEFFQRSLDDKYVATWKSMLKEVTSKAEKKEKKLKLVFHVLMLHMGLQLFNNSELADNAITELQAVLERVTTKKNTENEPEWIEVVTDLFLTLLSQESSVLRNVIKHVFPQLCSQMTVVAFHQILSMLDIRSKDNPLKMDESDSEDELESLDGDVSAEEQNEEGIEVDSESEVSDIDDDDEDPEAGVSDSIRMAVQNALEENGAGGSDIDVDDISPEDGKKLNLALGNAFKALMEAKNLKRKQKSKFEKMADKALLHFRMRLLDLVEIYLKNNPQMEICLEILTFFYDLMPFAYTNQQELSKRFEKIFVQLSQLKTFSLETVQNVTQKNLAETFSSLLDKTSREKINVQQQNYFKYACIFIIYSSHILQQLAFGEDDEVLKIVEHHLKEFISHRNPVLQVTTFTKILSIQWPGNFKFATMICDEGLKPDVRSLRRSQSLLMLKEFFKNHSLFQHNQKRAVKYCNRVCEHLKNYVSTLETMPQPELYELINLILAVRNVKEFTATADLVAAVQRFRTQHVLKASAFNVYRTLCTIMKIEFVANEKIEAASVVNGNAGEPRENGETKKRKKGNAKEKKLKKIKQLEEASQGLDENFSFV